MLKDSRKANRNLRLYVFFVFLFMLTAVMLIILGNYIQNLSHKKESNALSKSSTQITVIIDAGHGGEDCGAIGIDKKTLEKDINLKISLTLADMLRCAGISVRLTREEDILLYDRNQDYEGRKKVLDLARRAEIAQSYENAIFISIHLNSFPQAKYNGLQVYYSKNSPESSKLAEEIQSLSKELLQPQNNRKIKASGSNIYLLDKIQIPAVLIECGFLSNPKECQLLGTEEYQRQLAMTVYCSVINYLSNQGKF